MSRRLVRPSVRWPAAAAPADHIAAEAREEYDPGLDPAWMDTITHLRRGP